MISVIIPVFNEEEVIDLLFSRTMDMLKSMTEDFEVICVDDGSTDGGLIRLVEFHKKDKRFKVISLSRNFGHQTALFAGFSYAQGDTIAAMDADMQDPPELLPDFYRKLQEGSDVVYGIRKNRREGVLKRMTYRIFYRVLNSISKVHIPLDSGDFCMMKREVLEHILSMPEQNMFLRGIRAWTGFRQQGVKYQRDERAGGKAKYNIRMLLTLAYNGIFSFSYFPIRLLARLGFLTVLFSIGYGCYILLKRFFFGYVPEGFTTLILAIILFSGVQLIALGIIGEYVSRIYDETRNRPLYIIRKKYFD